MTCKRSWTRTSVTMTLEDPGRVDPEGGAGGSDQFVNPWLLPAVTLGVILLSLYAYGGWIFLLGFPDGFVSEQARLEERLAWAFIGVSAAVLARLAWLQRVKGPNLRRHLVWTLSLYGAWMLLTWVMDLYIVANFPGSAGG
jgi:hypothetical protein